MRLEQSPHQFGCETRKTCAIYADQSSIQRRPTVYVRFFRWLIRFLIPETMVVQKFAEGELEMPGIDPKDLDAVFSQLKSLFNAGKYDEMVRFLDPLITWK